MSSGLILSLSLSTYFFSGGFILRQGLFKDGIEILKNFGLLKKFLPELAEMDTTGASTVSEYVRGHKNIFWHTLFVLDNVAQQSDNVWLRIAALFHDIGKMKTRSWNAHKGWSFDNHEYVGAKMIKSIFR